MVFVSWCCRVLAAVVRCALCCCLTFCGAPRQQHDGRERRARGRKEGAGATPWRIRNSAPAAHVSRVRHGALRQHAHKRLALIARLERGAHRVGRRAVGELHVHRRLHAAAHAHEVRRERDAHVGAGGVAEALSMWRGERDWRGERTARRCQGFIEGESVAVRSHMTPTAPRHTTPRFHHHPPSTTQRISITYITTLIAPINPT